MSITVVLVILPPKLRSPVAFSNITTLFAGNVIPDIVALYLPVEVLDHVNVPPVVFCNTVATGAAVHV